MKPYYEKGGIQIFHADCREVLPELAKADLVLTDPPYGIDYYTNRGYVTATATWLRQKDVVAGDKDESLRDSVLANLTGVPFAVFGSIKTTPPVGTRGILVWDKGDGCGMGDITFPWKPCWELIYVGGDGWHGHRGSGVLRCCMPSRASMGREHPTEKPVPLLQAILRKGRPGVVLDPFMGSGTTLIAAAQLGRKAIGIEIEERYCEVAARRLQDMTPSLFAEVQP